MAEAVEWGDRVERVGPAELEDTLHRREDMAQAKRLGLGSALQLALPLPSSFSSGIIITLQTITRLM
jgi:hypothetical protein